MILVEQASATDHLDLLHKSVAYIRALYVEEHAHDFDLDLLKKGQFFVVRHEGLVIGCGAYVWHTDYDVELKHMFIEDTARGLGAGGALLKHIEEHAVASCVMKIILETSKKQVEAIGLYHKFGYIDCEPYVDDFHGEDIFMEKVL